MKDPQEIVSVYEAANVVEAHIVKNLLLEESIEAYVSEENEPFAGLPIAQCNVMVKVQDEDRARQVVNGYEESLLERANRPSWICAECGATIIGALDECDRCGADRPGGEE